MITGDYPGTALAIARQAGIATEGGALADFTSPYSATAERS